MTKGKKDLMTTNDGFSMDWRIVIFEELIEAEETGNRAEGTLVQHYIAPSPHSQE